ncbi:Uncharacterised protein [Shigella sonnei]|nr:Uncharacterised protein [Shigella sonnei]
MIFFPEGCRGDIPQTRVTTLTIVENLNVFPYYLDDFIPVIKTIVAQALIFQRSPEAFHRSVVVTVTFTRH